MNFCCQRSRMLSRVIRRSVYFQKQHQSHTQAHTCRSGAHYLLGVVPVFIPLSSSSGEEVCEISPGEARHRRGQSRPRFISSLFRGGRKGLGLGLQVSQKHPPPPCSLTGTAIYLLRCEGNVAVLTRAV